MKVKLSVVGMYFGTSVEIDTANPSVVDVLQASKRQTLTSNDARFDYAVTTSPNGQPDEFFISNITVTHLKPAKSRKIREGGQPNLYNSGVYSFSDQYTDAEARELIQRGQPLLVWQYYIFDAPADGGGDLGETVSDDGIIVAVNKSNSKYQIKEGGAVVLRLIALFGGPTGESYRKALQPGFASAKQLLHTFQKK